MRLSKAVTTSLSEPCLAICGLTPDEIAPKVVARTGAEILAYENDEDDLLVTVLWNYSRAEYHAPHVFT